MAHKAAGTSTTLGRDSASQRLGIKLFGGQKVRAGQIIVRQRGTKYHPGKNVRLAGDDTIYAATNGVVKFSKKNLRAFTGTLRQ
ncbi:MAG: 50S ribosomal protein L27, partial [Patescibacteria group bacterium]